MTAFIIVGLVGFSVLISGVMSNWTDSNLDFWLSYLKGSEVNSPFWVSIILIFIAPLLLLANIVMSLLRLVVL